MLSRSIHWIQQDRLLLACHAGHNEIQALDFLVLDVVVVVDDAEASGEALRPGNDRLLHQVEAHHDQRQADDQVDEHAENLPLGVELVH